MQKMRGSKTIKSIVRAVSVLNALSLDLRNISDISRELNLSISTVHRLLQTLKELGLVIQDPINHRYYLGSLLVKLASNPLTAHQYLIYCANEKMEYLRKITGETVSLDIKWGTERIKLQQLTGTRDITFVGRQATNEPIWIGAIGRVLLAQIPENELEVVLHSVELLPLTPRTITDKQVFKQEVAKVKQQGYATSYSETDLGVAAIAVPIENYVVPAAIAIIGPEDRLAPIMMHFLDELKSKAGEISQILLNIRLNNSKK